MHVRGIMTRVALLSVLCVAVATICAVRAEGTGVEVSGAADAAAAARSENCLALGFDDEAVDCRVCERMAGALAPMIVSDDNNSEIKALEVQILLKNCRSCCTDLEKIGVGATRHQHARAVLEVCTCKFGRYPKVANFVHNHAAQHTRLEVKYLNARHPHLLFYDEEGNKKEEISIASWDEATISEFIEAQLTKEEPKAADADALVDEAADTAMDSNDDASSAADDEVNAAVTNGESSATSPEEDEATDDKDDEDIIEVEVTAD